MALSFEDLKPGDYQPASVAGGLPKLVRIWEYLRELNTGGYGSGRLVSMKHGPGKAGSGITSCSPFTATVVYMAFDPRVTDGTKPWSLEGPYDPQFDGGKPLGPFFYSLHNSFSLDNYKSGKSWKADFKRDYVDRIPQFDQAWKFINHSAGSIVAHNLGAPVEKKKMRRGDLLGIDWHNGNGHATFCWNVHLNKNGDVDCFQFVSSNGTSAGGGAGITLFRWPYADPDYLDHSGGKYKKKKDMFAGIIDDPRAYPEYVKAPYWWFGLPGVKKGDIDLSSFGVPAKLVQVAYADTLDTSVHEVHVARLFGVTPPDPYLRADGNQPAAQAEPAKPPPVAAVKSKPAPSPSPAKQDAAKKDEPNKDAQAKAPEKAPPPAEPHPAQLEVEVNLQTLWIARWIEADPGKPDDVNDAQSQAALRDYQQRFMGGDVPVLGHADPQTRKRLAKSAAAALMMPLVSAALHLLFQKGKLKTKPGENALQLDAATRAAVKEFQKNAGLSADGIPGKETQEKLAAAMKEAAAQKPAEEPKPEAEQKRQESPPLLMLFYWAKNHGAPGQKVALKAVSAPGYDGKTCRVSLVQGEKTVVENAGQLSIKDCLASLEVTVPQGLAAGTVLQAKVSGGGVTSAPFIVDGPAKAGGPIAVVNGNDVMIEPPVRNLPQWDPHRWGPTRIAGRKDGSMLDWTSNGCNASSAAMILRWFAEDCRAGSIAFPTKPGGTVDKTWYGPRMGEAFWPNADPPGKVELTPEGRIHVTKLYGIAAHYLVSGGEIDASGKQKSDYVSSKPKQGWLDLIREKLKSGPCMVGIGAPADGGHFVVAHAVVDGALLVTDPGNVLYSAAHGGKKHVALDWKGKDGFLDGGEHGENADKVRMPKTPQWPGGKAPGSEGDHRAYNRISGKFLEDMLADLHSVVSLTHPAGAKLASGAQPAAQPSPAPTDPAPEPAKPATPTESADWRPYIGKGELPAEVLEAVKKNRARYPQKTLPLVTQGKYAGALHYDYKPPADHAKWAKAHFQKKVDAAPAGGKNVAKAFVLMLDAEGRPASLQTYDNQIVTWGVGLGAKGDGVHAFEELNKDPKMKKLLDDIGINYDGGDYHVVDLAQKKVVSSAAGKKGDDNRHVVALEAWRRQADLLSAIIGISEDEATREAVAESQYAVYLSNSTRWAGQDKVFTLALFFMITHMYQWLPAIAKRGFDVPKEFQGIGGGTPSLQTDAKLAVRIARGFVRYAKQFYADSPAKYEDVHTRTKTRLWAKMREDGKAEGFDPGELTYED